MAKEIKSAASKKGKRARNRKRNVLITGVTGTVGSRLAEARYRGAMSGDGVLLAQKATWPLP